MKLDPKDLTEIEYYRKKMAIDKAFESELDIVKRKKLYNALMKAFIGGSGDEHV